MSSSAPRVFMGFNDPYLLVLPPSTLKEEEEMRQLDECDLQEFGRLESYEKTIAIRGHLDGGHRRRNRKGIG